MMLSMLGSFRSLFGLGVVGFGIGSTPTPKPEFSLERFGVRLKRLRTLCSGGVATLLPGVFIFVRVLRRRKSVRSEPPW